jgi:hypothetical protein
MHNKSAVNDLEPPAFSTPAALSPKSKASSEIQLSVTAFPRLLQLLRSQLGELGCWLLDELEPWAKWMFYDALFAVLIASLVRRSGKLEAAFSLLGWV